MFYRNKLKTLSTSEKEFEYALFDKIPTEESDDIQKAGSGKLTYNLITEDGCLKTGYGFEELKMPQTQTELDDETVVNLRGTEIKAIWKLKHYEKGNNRNNYYIFYYNDENYICYDNLFNTRILSFIVPNNFTDVPYALYYRVDSEDMLLFFGEGDDLIVMTGYSIENVADVPIIKSCCSHYGKLFAITASQNSELIYNEELDFVSWSNEKTKNLDFNDERGCLNKIISFDDYVYVFRDYGITQLSIYGSNEDFSINHMYLSDSYIYPNTIAQSGDNVYFLERNALKCFNGSTVKEIELDCKNLIASCRQSNAFATCYEGKYFLACRCDYMDGQSIGCENYVDGYKNNTLLIYDIEKEHVEIVRGVDINQLLALNNPLKSKLVACFNHQHKAKIGQLSNDGKLFGTQLSGFWQSTKTDLGFHGVKKRIKHFTIKSTGDAVVTITSEKASKNFTISGSSKIQKIRTNIIGNEFDVKICSGGNTNISNFVLVVSVKQWKYSIKIQSNWLIGSFYLLKKIFSKMS